MNNCSSEPFVYGIITTLAVSSVWFAAYISPSTAEFPHESLFTINSLLLIAPIPFLIAFAPKIFQQIRSKASTATKGTLKEAKDKKTPKGSGIFRFLAPFNETDKEDFFGRDEEVRELVNHLTNIEQFSTGFYLITGHPGNGKSSFINAGFVPRMKKEKKQYLPVVVHGLKEKSPTSNIPMQIRDAVYQCDKDSLGYKTKCNDYPQLTNYLESILDNPNGQYKKILLILDQFEEFFIRYGYEDRKAFISFVNQMTKTPDRIQFVFSIRHDWFLNMDTFREDRVDVLSSNVMLNYLFLRGLSREQAREIVDYSNEFTGRDSLVDKALDSLAGEEQTISTAEFQLIFSSLLDKTEYQNASSFKSKGKDDKEAKENIISDYVYKQVGRDERKFRILRTLVGPDEKRLELTLDEILQISREEKDLSETDKKKWAEILSDFESSRIIRKDVRESGTTYRLMHDYLIPKVLNFPEHANIARAIREHQILYRSGKSADNNQEGSRSKTVVLWAQRFFVNLLLMTIVLKGFGKSLCPDFVQFNIDFSFVPQAIVLGALAWFVYIYYESILDIPLLRKIDLKSKHTNWLHIPASWVPMWAFICGILSIYFRQWGICFIALAYILAIIKNRQLSRAFKSEGLRMRFATLAAVCTAYMGAVLTIGLFFGLLFKYGLNSAELGSNIIIDKGAYIFSEYLNLTLGPKTIEETAYMLLYLVIAIFTFILTLITVRNTVHNEAYAYELKGLLINEDRRWGS